MQCLMPQGTWYADYSAEGPLLEQCGLEAEVIRSDSGRWVDLGRVLSSSLGFPDGWDALSEFDR